MEKPFLLSEVTDPLILKALDLFRSLFRSDLFKMPERCLSSRKNFLATRYRGVLTLECLLGEGTRCFATQVEDLGQVVRVLVLHFPLLLRRVLQLVKFTLQVVFDFERIQKLVFYLGFQVTVVYMGRYYVSVI